MVGVCESYCVESGVEANMILEGGSKISLQKMRFPSLLDFIKSVHDACHTKSNLEYKPVHDIGLDDLFWKAKKCFHTSNSEQVVPNIFQC